MKENLNKLIEQITSIHELTKDTCEICGGSYEENLDGAQAYFILNGVRFALTVSRK